MEAPGLRLTSIDTEFLDALKKAQAERRAADDAERAAAIKWARASDLRAVPIPVLGQDPRASEMHAASEAVQINMQRAAVRSILDGIDSQKNDEGRCRELAQSLIGIIRNIIPR